MGERYENRATDGKFNYSPETEEYGAFAQNEVGDIVTKVCRIMTLIYDNGNGYRIYDVECQDRRFTIAGNFPYTLEMNNFYKVTGEISLYKKAKQIKVKSCESTMPTDRHSVVTVLRTLNGLDTKAEMLYEIMGPDILDILMNDPKQVVEKVRGVGMKRALSWQMELKGRSDNDYEIQKLYQYELTAEQANKLVSQYGIEICSEVERNPYFLIGKFKGFTFHKCDEMALKKGGDARADARLRKGLVTTMRALEKEGHTSYPVKELIKKAQGLLNIALGIRTAEHSLKEHLGKSQFAIKIGSKHYLVPMDDLAFEVKQWRSATKKSSEKFRYVIDRIEPEILLQMLRELERERVLILETAAGTQYVTMMDSYEAELNIVSAVREFVANAGTPFHSLQETIMEVLREEHVELEAKQMEAMQTICKTPGGMFILCGPAGCGKTFVMNLIIKVLSRLFKRELKRELDPCILAPSGKAAKVAARATLLPASTIHRGLGLMPDENSRTEKVLFNNCLIVDEFSMVDTILGSQTLHGIPPFNKLVILGDYDQLASIKKGKVLKDLIESGVVPVIILNVVKRQGANTGTLINSTKINEGQLIDTVITNHSGIKGNAYVIHEDSPYKARERILKNVEHYGLEAFYDEKLQILSPLQAGPTGVLALNKLIQDRLNPKKDGQVEVQIDTITMVSESGREQKVPFVLREGDYVINTDNNYEQVWYEKDGYGGFVELPKKGVVNGDTGKVDTIQLFTDHRGFTHPIIYVKIDEHYIAYEHELLDQLTLAYVMTIHKAQGSQWPIVICAMCQYAKLLQRKMIYSMYTRAQDTNILIGRQEYIRMAIENNPDEHRVTLLKERLQGIV